MIAAAAGRSVFGQPNDELTHSDIERLHRFAFTSFLMTAAAQA
jgi:hypothetical protein